MGVGIGAGCSVFLVIAVLATCLVLAFGSGGLGTPTTANHGAANGTATSKATNTAKTPAAATTTVTAATPTTACTTGAVNCNPWGYNFTNGSRIFNPAGEFCSFFKCISNFWSGKGYVVECRDSTYSKQGGEKHSCMRHRGELRTLLQP
jgi:hypothetical protein